MRKNKDCPYKKHCRDACEGCSHDEAYSALRKKIERLNSGLERAARFTRTRFLTNAINRIKADSWTDFDQERELTMKIKWCGTKIRRGLPQEGDKDE